MGAPRRKSAEAPKPKANVATTPNVETRRAAHPTDIISRTFDARPTSKSRMTTPISASAETTASALSRSTQATPKSDRLPSSLPPASSPSTAGCPARASSSPHTFATTSITATDKSTNGSSPGAPVPAPAPPSGVAARADAQQKSTDSAASRKPFVLGGRRCIGLRSDFFASEFAPRVGKNQPGLLCSYLSVEVGEVHRRGAEFAEGAQRIER